MQEFLIISALVSWIVIILNLFITFALVRSLNKHENNQNETLIIPLDILPVGENAPKFVAQTLDGENVSNSDYLGKVSVFTVVSDSCEPCHNFVAGIDEKLQAEIRKLGLNFVLIGTETLEEMKAFVETTHTPFPSLVAPRISNSFINDYKIPGTPVSYVLDEENRIKWIGYPSVHTISQLLKEWAS